jgi:hypothetical protein
MSDSPTPAEVVLALDEHPLRDELTALVRKAAFEAAEQRRTGFASHTAPGERHAPVVLPDGLVPEDAKTPFGNVVSVLERGVETPTEALLIGALLALSAREVPESEAVEQRFAAHAAWLAGHTPCDALLALDAAAGDREELWRAVSRVAVVPADIAPDFGRTEALLAAAALGSSHSAAAAPVRSRALERAKDPAVRALLAAGGVAREPLEGELVPAPFGTLSTIVLTLTLALGVVQLWRLGARYAFGYRRPAAFSLTERGLELTYRVELLGKVLSERTELVPLANLSRVIREVDYARAGVYAGLGALVLGTYFGMGLFVDALRVPGGSGSLLAMAVALMVMGLAVDFALSSGLDGLRGRCKLLIERRKGPVICLGAIDVDQADAMLMTVTAVASGAHGPSLLPPPPA